MPGYFDAIVVSYDYIFESHKNKMLRQDVIVLVLDIMYSYSEHMQDGFTKSYHYNYQC